MMPPSAASPCWCFSQMKQLASTCSATVRPPARHDPAETQLTIGQQHGAVRPGFVPACPGLAGLHEPPPQVPASLEHVGMLHIDIRARLPKLAPPPVAVEGGDGFAPRTDGA